MPSERRRHGRAPAGERHMDDVDAECELEELACEMRRRTPPRRRVAQFARARLRQRNELFGVARRDRRMHREHVRRRAHQAHRLEIPLGIVRNLGIEARVDDEVAAGGEQRVTVRRRARRGADAEIAAGAGHVLHVELLPEKLAELLGKQARGGVVRSAGGDRNDHPHGPARVCLRPTACGAEGSRSSARRESEDATAG